MIKYNFIYICITHYQYMYMSNQEQVYNRLMDELKNLGIKQSDLVKRTKYTQPYMSAIYNRRVPITTKLLTSIHSQIPELDYEYIMYGEQKGTKTLVNNEVLKLKTELEFAKQEIAWLKAVINKALAIEPELRSKLSEFIAPGMVVLPNTTQWTPQGAVA